MTDETLVRRSAALLEAEVDGELVALHVDSGTCFGFNLPATRIWALIEEAKTVGEVRQALLRDFDVDPETCSAELEDVLKQMEADGLVQLEPAA